MNKASLRLCVVACGVCLIGTAAVASDKKDSPAPPAPFISAVNGDSITVTTGTAAKTLAVKSNSEILLNGQRVPASELKVGMPVTNLGVGTDPAVVSRISVASAPEPPPSGRKKKK